MNKKHLPEEISNRLLRQLLQSRIATYTSYWIFQGMLYMDYRETCLKCFLDVVCVCLFYYLFSLNFFIAFLMVHTLNMFFNGHFFAMQRHMGFGANDPERFIAYVENLQERIESKQYIAGAAAYGSLSRNVFKPTSDIDIRIIPTVPSVSFLLAAVFAFCERARAFLSGFPLDLYVFEAQVLQKKMNPKEVPIIFGDSQSILGNMYKDTIQADLFFRAFRETHVPKK
jgi:predicted nucleotidyltransferase